MWQRSGSLAQRRTLRRCGAAEPGWTRLSTASLYLKRFRWRSHMCRDYAGGFPLDGHVPVLQLQNLNFFKSWKKLRKSWWFRWVGAIRPKRWDGRGQKDLFMPFLSDFCVCLCGCDDVAVPVQPCPLPSLLSLHPHICSSVLLSGQFAERRAFSLFVHICFWWCCVWIKSGRQIQQSKKYPRISNNGGFNLDSSLWTRTQNYSKPVPVLFLISTVSTASWLPPSLLHHMSL